jgi:hypothetical protein
VIVGNWVEQFGSHLKKAFSPGSGVESLSQILDIREYACGLILGLALNSKEYPDFEIASRFLKNKVTNQN